VSSSVAPVRLFRAHGDRLFSFRRSTRIAVSALLGAGLLCPTSAVAGPDHERLAERAEAAVARAAALFRDEVAVHGSYGWRYSADLSYRRGEDLITTSQGWVQPPGTPAVGLAMLQAFEATGDRTFLDGAAETARALALTQLDSGGW